MSWTRTLILWLVVAGLFVALLWVPGGLSGDSALRWAPLLFVVVFVFVLAFFVVKARRGLAENNRASVLLAEGRVLESLALFEAAGKSLRNPLPLVNVARCQLLLWRVHDAAATLDAFDARMKRPLNGFPQGERVGAQLGVLVHALLGNTAGTERTLALAAETTTGRLASAVIAARAGDFAAAEKLLEQHAVVLDQLGGSLRAFAEVLAAYVASKTGGRAREVPILRMFRESSPDQLKAVWPELHAFLVRAQQGPELPR
ncbi:MAG: hypothetical protein K1X89_12445 [Myxococcaceae bacterium]|nr:hypothetical protein [Myxococcaceae bacterium]